MSNNTASSTSLSEEVRPAFIVPPKDSTVTKDKNDKSGHLSIILDYCLNASTHGLFGIARSGTLHNRVFWSISFLGFTALMTYFVVSAILNYFGYPTNIDVDVVNEWPQYFPAFSLCNASPLRMDRFIEAFLNYTNALNLTNTNDTTTLTEIQAGYIWNFVVDSINSNQSIKSMFYSLPTMLYSCSFNSVHCSAADFIPFLSAQYGLCYTFNAKLQNSNNNSVRYGNQYGGNGKLDLSLYVQSHQYVPYVFDGIGMVVLLHDNAAAPLIEAAGIALAPGRKHILGYKKKTTFFLSSPYTTCTNKISRQMQAMLDNYDGADYGYDETICYELCKQVYVYEQCGCVDPTLWNARSIVLPDTSKFILAPLCYFTNACYISAKDVFLRSVSLLNKYCVDCSGECSITNFPVETSSLTTPLEWQMNGIKSFVENSSVPLPANWSTTWRQQIQANYLQVSVIRETTIVENYTQIAKIQLVDVLSNIGGQTSLWIGMSFLSMMELAEMFYRLIQYQYQKIRRARQAIPN